MLAAFYYCRPLTHAGDSSHRYTARSFPHLKHASGESCSQPLHAYQLLPCCTAAAAVWWGEAANEEQAEEDDEAAEGVAAPHQEDALAIVALYFGTSPACIRSEHSACVLSEWGLLTAHPLHHRPSPMFDQP